MSKADALALFENKLGKHNDSDDTAELVGRTPSPSGSLVILVAAPHQSTYRLEGIPRGI
jgi:hypothetical protein